MRKTIAAMMMLWACGGGNAGLEKRIETLETNVSELRQEVSRINNLVGAGKPTTSDSGRWWYCVASNPYASSESQRAKGELTAFTACFRTREQCESMLTTAPNCVPVATAWCPPAGSKWPCTFDKESCGTPGSPCKREAP